MVLPSGIEPESPASEASVLSVRLQEQGATRGGGPGGRKGRTLSLTSRVRKLFPALSFVPGQIGVRGPSGEGKQAGFIVLKNSLARPEGVSEFAARPTRRMTLSSNG